MKKIKNVIIVNDFDYVQGGASKVAIQTAEMLTQEMMNVIFFSGTSTNTIQNKNIKLYSTNQKEALKEKNKFKGFINGIYNLKAKKELKKILNQYSKEDTIINVHGWTKVLSSSIFSIAFKKNFKVYLTLHDYFSICPNGGFFDYKKNKICQLKPGSVKCIARNCDSRNRCFKIYRLIRLFVQNKIVGLPKKIKYAIGISNVSVNKIKQYLPSTNIKIIYNPLDLEEVEKIEPSKNFYYTYIGRVSQEKGLREFCETMKDYKNVLIIGDGPLKKELEDKYSNMEFVGWKNSKEIAEYLQKTRILILPSLWYEGAPLVPLEAMNYGIPCIISDKCSAVEYIKDNGEIYNPNESTSLIEATNKVEKNISKYGNNAKKYVELRKKNNYCKQLMDFFNE